jgi:coenzyme F420-0:L-glutamate ligase/coenzyme F420-1:gamma-L-glutamate ligase
LLTARERVEETMSASDGRITVTPVRGVPPVRPGDALPALLSNAMRGQGLGVAADDVLVVAQKVVSKAEGACVDLRQVKPGAAALELAAELGKDPRVVEVVLSQSTRIVRKARGVLITETHHGFVCANAGVDASNALGPDIVTLLPPDPDASARRLREGIGALLGVEPGVMVSDSFNRPWREGSINVAIGTAGFYPLDDRRGQTDDAGRTLRVTLVSVADEVASAAQLVMGESGGVPAAVVSGLSLKKSNAGSAVLKRDPALDLFR